MFYEKEIKALKKFSRFRKRVIYSDNLIDLASNDYLGLSSNKKIFKNAYKKVYKEKYFSPKSSILVNGYSNIHKKFEQELCRLNKFDNALVIGSGFLANIALIESMVRKGDILFIDEDYHASGILATALVQGEVIKFKHNDYKDLETKIKTNKTNGRVIVAIEGVYSMSGDIACKQFSQIADKNNAILIVDEAHSSGVIGKNLLGWFDYWNIKPKQNHVKMGTLGKAYASFGAYILASNHIISFLENRAKPVIYSTAPSLIDIAIAHQSLKYIIKNKKRIKKKITKYQKIVSNKLSIKTQSLIVPIKINNNKKVIDIQNKLLKDGFVVGAIRQPTVSSAIIRMILKLDIKESNIKSVCKLIKSKV